MRGPVCTPGSEFSSVSVCEAALLPFRMHCKDVRGVQLVGGAILRGVFRPEVLVLL